jgi:hypothetical protein
MTRLTATEVEDLLSCVGKGWSKILTSLIEDLFKLGWDGEVAQVKEKFGGLRFYIGAASQEVHDRIHEAENESYKTCEVCGAPGKLTNHGWIRTLCEAHTAAERCHEFVQSEKYREGGEGVSEGDLPDPDEVVS